MKGGKFFKNQEATKLNKSRSFFILYLVALLTSWTDSKLSLLLRLFCEPLIICDQSNRWIAFCPWIEWKLFSGSLFLLCQRTSTLSHSHWDPIPLHLMLSACFTGEWQFGELYSLCNSEHYKILIAAQWKDAYLGLYPLEDMKELCSLCLWNWCLLR